MKYESFLKNSITDDLLISNSQRLYRYNPASGQYLDSVAHPHLYPNYILSPANDIMLTEFTPVKSIDPLTLDITPAPVKNYLKNFSNSSYGLGILGKGMCIYDFRNNVKISDVSILPYKDKYISGDNKYLLEYDDFYNKLECFLIGDNMLTSLWTTNTLSYFLVPQTPEILLTCSDYNFEVRNMATGQIVFTIPVNSWTSIEDVDPDSKIVVLYTSMDEKLYLYNYETGLLVRSFDATFTDYFLKKNVLYSSKGFKLPLAIKKK
jgi:WD40 repeat protein